MTPILISNTGSDRATGYSMSSKIIRTDDLLYVGWLDAPSDAGDTATIRLGCFDPSTLEQKSTLTLGEGIDNHCGPALAMDPDGSMHTVIGAHHGPFLYRWSNNPSNDSSWSEPEPLGPDDTYPSLAIDANGTLHLAHREKTDRWQLWYRRKKKGMTWEDPVSIAVSPTPGYNHYMMSLTVGPTGTLHLLFQFHYADTGRAEDCKGRAAVYLRSLDSGETWLDDADEAPELPITIETMKAIRHVPDGGDDRHAVRVGNHTVDADDRMWAFASFQGYKSGILFRRDPDGWKEFDLAPMIDARNMEGGRSTSVSQSPDGRIHLTFSTHPDGKRTNWYDPSLELFSVSCDQAGRDVHLEQLTETDPNAAHWLPSLENWDWNWSSRCCRDGHYLTYTRGLNAGGIGGDNKSPLKTEVYLCRI